MSSIMRATNSIGKLYTNSSILFLCDMQEKFRPTIKFFPQIIDVSKRLLNSFKILGCPIIVTEQYPKGLGPTVNEFQMKENGLSAIEKTQFSMCVSDIQANLVTNNIQSVILCGIEAHVCVQNTALDLIEKGYDVHIVVDAVSSRSMTDRIFAFQRMKSSGAFLTTSESVILGLAGGSHHPKFKELQKIIMESAPDTGLLQHLSAVL